LGRRGRSDPFAVANSKIIGAELGNIIAAIMIHHMANISTPQLNVQLAPGIGICIPTIPFIGIGAPISMPAPANR
jgi:hypothetical protein